MESNIEDFLKELRESYDGLYEIFTQGSCARLYFILKVIFPSAELYWSSDDNHAITKIDNRFYDIGGLIKEQYVKLRGYYKVDEGNINGFKLLKYINEDKVIGALPEKYV